MPLEEKEERIWEEGEEGYEEEGYKGDDASSDWTRLRRFHSLDEVLDEAGRISRSFYEGDIEKWASSDEKAPVKAVLLLRQLRAVVENLEQICRNQGWLAR
jgi:hypothetical protein